MAELEPFASIAMRVSVTYMYVLALLRLTGKRGVGQLTGPDVVSTIVVGDMFDNVIWSDVSLAKGMVGITTVMALHFLSNALEWGSRPIERLLDGGPVLAVLNGGLVGKNLRRERVSVSELRELLRLQGVEALDEVREARIEVNGEASVLRAHDRKPAQRHDRDKLLDTLSRRGRLAR